MYLYCWLAKEKDEALVIAEIQQEHIFTTENEYTDYGICDDLIAGHFSLLVGNLNKGLWQREFCQMEVGGGSPQ